MNVEIAQSILPQPTPLICSPLNGTQTQHPTILTYLAVFEDLTADALNSTFFWDIA
jgi:hypothetical protein